MTPPPRTLLACVLVLAVATASAGTPVPDVPRDLADYVLLADSKAKVGKDAFIASGNVGANAAGVLLKRRVFMADDSALVSDKVELGKEASVFDLFVNTFIAEPGEFVIRGVGPLALAPPVVTPLPSLPSFAPGTTEVVVKSDESLVLPPGAYGEVKVARNAVLTLTGGAYELASLKTGKLSHVFVLASSVINIAGDFKVGHLAAFGPSSSNPVERNVVVNVGGEHVRLSPATHVSIELLAPNATLRLGKSFHGTGHYLAGTIIGGGTLNVRTPTCIGESCDPLPASLCTLEQAAYGDPEGAANGAGGAVTLHPEVLPLTVGGPGLRSLTVENQQALACLLPATGTAAALCTGLADCSDVVADACTNPPILDLDQPGTGSAGVGGGELTGELITAKLNVALAAAGAFAGGSVENLLLPTKLCTTRCPEGRELDPNDMEFQKSTAGAADGLNTFGDLIAIADQALAVECAPRTCANVDQAAAFPPNPTSRSTLAHALRTINECFAGCASVIPCPED